MSDSNYYYAPDSRSGTYSYQSSYQQNYGGDQLTPLITSPTQSGGHYPQQYSPLDYDTSASFSQPMTSSPSASSDASYGSKTSKRSYDSYGSRTSWGSESFSASPISPTGPISPYPTQNSQFSDIDFNYDGVIKSSRGNKSRKSIPGEPDGPQYICLYPGCKHKAARQFDLNRHVQDVHVAKTERILFDCPGKGCGRIGEHGFKRKDHLTEHLRKVHAKNIPKRKDSR